MASVKANADERPVPPYLSLGRIARLSGLSRDTVFLLSRKGVLAPVNTHGKLLFRKRDVFEWLETV